MECGVAELEDYREQLRISHDQLRQFGAHVESAPKAILSVLIVEDHLLVRQGLKHVISQEYRDLVFGEAGSAAEAETRLSTQLWDLIILDIGLPGADGFAVLDSIRAQGLGSPVLVVSMHSDPLYVARARELGAAGYVSKSAPRSELVKAIKIVLGKRRYFPIPHGASSTKPPHTTLSQREYGVMLAIAAGQRPGEIADALGVSIKTVSTFKRRMMTKMSFQSTADLVRYALQNRLL
jgi:two-component system, NarL family, invasion response regulator UvrY